MDSQEFYCQGCEALVTGRIVQRTPRSPGRARLVVISSDGRAHDVIEGIEFKWLTRKEIDAREKKRAERAAQHVDRDEETNAQAFARLFGRCESTLEGAGANSEERSEVSAKDNQ